MLTLIVPLSFLGSTSHASGVADADPAGLEVPIAPPALPAPTAARQAEYDRAVPKTALEIQRFRAVSTTPIVRADGAAGTARLTDVLPTVGRTFLLDLKWPGQYWSTWHLESREGLTLTVADNDLAVVGRDGTLHPCGLLRDGGKQLAAARGKAYTPVCDGLVVVRSPVEGRKTSIEWTTDFLRDNVPGGQALTEFVRDTFFADSELRLGALVDAPDPPAAAGDGPPAQRIDPALAGALLVPQDFGLEVVGRSPDGYRVGAWYPVVDQPGVYASVTKPGAVDPALVASLGARVNPLDAVESEALVYAVAFDMDAFEFDFVLGTDHPRVVWSERAPEWATTRYENLLGPDGFEQTAPFVRVGQVDPADVPDVVAAFTGGFKRMHGAFGVGALGRSAMGHHYGFAEDGVVYSKLQAGLSTLVGWDDGRVELLTWTPEHDAHSARVRFARQNGVPLVAPDAATGEPAPGPLVPSWTGGNWASSPEARLRSLRASASVVEDEGTRWFVVTWFSDATPSAMAATLLAYGADYGMLLDMNALEHTYTALYTHGPDGPVPHHLATGMSVLDRTDGDRVLPRFLAFPDDRDFFTLRRKVP